MSIHYHVWFHFKSEIGDTVGLDIAARFLREVRDQGIHCELLKNSGTPPKSLLDRYHAFFVFDDQNQMDAVFGAKRRQGIHNGAHGELIRAVGAFHVEVFSRVED